MVTRQALLEYCDDLLDVTAFKDYCPNGLQVEGKENIRTIVSGVTASQALIDAAIVNQADLLLVHHGFFWKGENPVVTAMKRQRLKALLLNDVNLLAYHLPLDAHKVLGNNVLLAQHLGLHVEGHWGSYDMGVFASLPVAQSGEQFKQQIHQLLQREPLHIAVDRPIRRLAVCSGAAQSSIHQAIDAGCDAYISGEVSENTWHIARESGIHYYAAGHHATERYGVHALGEQLACQFDLLHRFIDSYNPV